MQMSNNGFRCILKKYCTFRALPVCILYIHKADKRRRKMNGFRIPRYLYPCKIMEKAKNMNAIESSVASVLCAKQHARALSKTEGIVQQAALVLLHIQQKRLLAKYIERRNSRGVWGWWVRFWQRGQPPVLQRELLTLLRILMGSSCGRLSKY